MNIKKKLVKVKPTEEYSKKYIENKKATTKRNQTLKTLDEANKEYFMSMLDAFENSVVKGINPDAKIMGNLNYTPMELFNIVMLYFRSCIANGVPLTKTGISLFCEMDRGYFEAFLVNMDEHPEYKFLNKCEDFVEMYMECTAQTKANPAFQIFWLKNKGWKDKFEVEASTTQGALSEEEREAAQRRVMNFSEGKFLEERIKE